MLNLLLVLTAVYAALRAIRSPRLIRSALWLAGVSALVATLLYRLGAHEVAVIELSVGAGLVTVLFVFAMAIAGEDAMEAGPIVPRWLSVSLLLLVIGLLGWLVLPAGEQAAASHEAPFSEVLWQQRGLDTLVQVALIFAGTLGVLGLLAPKPDTVAEEAVAGAAEEAAQKDGPPQWRPVLTLRQRRERKQLPSEVSP